MVYLHPRKNGMPLGGRLAGGSLKAAKGVTGKDFIFFHFLFAGEEKGFYICTRLRIKVHGKRARQVHRHIGLTA